MEFLPDGKRILLGSHWGNAVIWDIENDREVVEIPVSEGHTFSMSHDGRFVAIDDGQRLVDTTTGLTVLEPAWTPDGVQPERQPIRGVTGESWAGAVDLGHATLEMVSEIPCGCR